MPDPAATSANSDEPIVRRAATVALVRDDPTAAGGLTTYLLERNPELEFAPGATVFPGGAVDDDDHHPRWALRCDGLTDPQANAELDVETGGLAYYVAAARECFEEVGILLSDGSQVDRSIGLDAASATGRRLAMQDVWYLGRWITPQGAPRRYDTRFFVTHAPAGQRPAPDQNELLAGAWYRPEDALADFEAGRIDLILPTLVTLEFFQRFATVDRLFDALSHPRGQSPDMVDHLGGRIRRIA